MDVDPSYLTAFYKEHFAAQADKLMEVYVGRRMRVSGPIDDVTGWMGWSFFVNLARDTHATPLPPDLFLSFQDRSQLDRISALKRGTRVTIEGRITSASAAQVRFDDCELVEEEGTLDAP